MVAMVVDRRRLTVALARCNGMRKGSRKRFVLNGRAKHSTITRPRKQHLVHHQQPCLAETRSRCRQRFFFFQNVRHVPSCCSQWLPVSPSNQLLLIWTRTHRNLKNRVTESTAVLFGGEMCEVEEGGGAAGLLPRNLGEGRGERKDVREGTRTPSWTC